MGRESGCWYKCSAPMTCPSLPEFRVFQEKLEIWVFWVKSLNVLLLVANPNLKNSWAGHTESPESLLSTVSNAESEFWVPFRHEGFQGGDCPWATFSTF